MKKCVLSSSRLGRQARPGFEPRTSRLPVSSVTTLPLDGQEMVGKHVKHRFHHHKVDLDTANLKYYYIQVRQFLFDDISYFDW